MLKTIQLALLFFLLFLLSAACSTTPAPNPTPVSVSQPTATLSPTSAPIPTKVSPAADAIFRKRPYLVYTGNNTSMTVMWQSDKTPASASIEWGDAEDYKSGKITVKESNSEPDGHQFSHAITGLKPGTRYYYRVSMDKGTQPGSFMTGLASNADSFAFYAYGDTRIDPRRHDAVIAGILRDVDKNPSTRQTFVLHNGDYVSHGHYEKDWDTEYFFTSAPNTMKLFARMPIIGALGNHELYPATKFEKECSNPGRLFRKYYPYPMYVKPENFYYSFDYGSIHFTVIDPYTADYTKETSEQWRWLKADLSQPPLPSASLRGSSTWKIVMMHPPAWAYRRSGYALRQNLHELFKANGVQIVIAGHEHYYSRLVVDGIQYITTGGGGAELTYPGVFNDTVFDPSDIEVMSSCVRVPFVADAKIPAVTIVDPKTAARQYHFVRFELANGKLTASAINVEGKVIDCIPEGDTCEP